jgi:hypothetical protein
MAEELTVPPYQRSIGEAYPVGTKPWHGQEPQTMPSRAMVRSRSMERSWREIRITSSASVGWVLRRSSHAGTGTRITTPELLRRNWYYFQISEFRFSYSILPAIFTSLPAPAIYFENYYHTNPRLSASLSRQKYNMTMASSSSTSAAEDASPSTLTTPQPVIDNKGITPLQYGFAAIILGASAGLTLYTKKTSHMLNQLERASANAAQRKGPPKFGPKTKTEWEMTRNRWEKDDI